MVHEIPSLKSRIPTSVSVEFLISLEEIKPWPVGRACGFSSSSVVLQWERGDSLLGNSKSVAPSPDENSNVHKLVFNEELRLARTLHREQPQHRNNSSSAFQKENVNFTLITVNGQILARAVLDLAEHAKLDSSMSRSAALPLTTGKRVASAGESGIPTLYLRISCFNATSSGCVHQYLKEAASARSSSFRESSASANRNEDRNTLSKLSDQIGAGATVESKQSNSRSLRVSSAAAAAASAYTCKKSMMLREGKISFSSSLVDSYFGPGSSATEEDVPISGSNFPIDGFIANSFEIGLKASTAKVEGQAQEEMEGRTEGQLGFVQAARMKFEKGAESRNEKVDRQALDTVKLKVHVAEAKAAAALDKVKQLEAKAQQLEGELADVAAVEASLYSVVAQHGRSPHKVHRPARRIARLYIHACKSWSQDRRASCARSCISGMVLIARACGSDVTRLSFWLSNAVVLRETISQAFDLVPKFPSSTFSNVENSQISTSAIGKSTPVGVAHYKQILWGALTDWREPKTLVMALEHVERWIFGRIIESVWWQALTPPMQKSNGFRLQTSYSNGFHEQRSSGVQFATQEILSHDLRAIHEGNLCLELWKSAFVDVVQRVCPVRAGGHECGCLQQFAKMILEECMHRLDVAMFNAILRDNCEWVPMDPIADPIVDPTVLPIRVGRLSFGDGAQLKVSIRTWSSWLIAFTSRDSCIDRKSMISCPQSTEGTQAESKNQTVMFPLLTTLADLLMLPKDMLLDKSVRREFEMEKQVRGEADPNLASTTIVNVPYVKYAPPSSSYVRELIGDATSRFRLDRSSSSLLKKAHTSDDELDELESPLSIILDPAPLKAEGVEASNMIHREGFPINHASKKKIEVSEMDSGFVRRYQLIKEVWYSH